MRNRQTYARVPSKSDLNRFGWITTVNIGSGGLSPWPAKALLLSGYFTNWDDNLTHVQPGRIQPFRLRKRISIRMDEKNCTQKLCQHHTVRDDMGNNDWWDSLEQQGGFLSPLKAWVVDYSITCLLISSWTALSPDWAPRYDTFHLNDAFIPTEIRFNSSSLTTNRAFELGSEILTH